MATLDGTAGNDRLPGTPDGDVISGQGGDDKLRGLPGDDTLFGADGADSIDAGLGNDSIYGGAGNDRLEGARGDDLIEGGSGDDTAYGDLGDDTVEGGDGRDRLFGGAGNDAVSGGAGDDSVSGRGGDDRLDGGEGSDRVYGGGGADVLRAGDDDDAPDTLYGDQGTDTIFGGFGDSLNGGGASDLFVVNADGGTGQTSIWGGDDNNAEVDVLDLSGLRAAGLRTEVSYRSQDREDGTVRVLDADGRLVNTIRFTEIETVICFAAGTRIATRAGEVAVEALRPGDQVLTRDNGFRALRWAGRRDLGRAELVDAPAFQPVLVRAGALAPGVPERDLVVSPQHRLLFAGPSAEIHFGEHEVLVAARHLVGRPGIERLTAPAVSYCHLLFDRHEVVLSNGAWTESFQPGDWSLGGIGARQREEVLALFPELRQPAGVERYVAARRVLRRVEAALLRR